MILHDPQTAGLVSPALAAGANVVWRCHVGLDVPNDQVREAWAFLEPYVRPAHAYVFSRGDVRLERLDPDRVRIIRPSIDVFSPKNQKVAPENVQAILQAAGLLADGDRSLATFRPPRREPGPGRPARAACRGCADPSDAPVVCQVSRWDELKDPRRRHRGFASGARPRRGAPASSPGPDVEAVSDDPRGSRS